MWRSDAWRACRSKLVVLQQLQRSPRRLSSEWESNSSSLGGGGPCCKPAELRTPEPTCPRCALYMLIQHPILEGLPEGTLKGEATYRGSKVGLFQLSLLLFARQCESQSQKLYSLCTCGILVCVETPPRALPWVSWQCVLCTPWVCPRGVHVLHVLGRRIQRKNSLCCLCSDATLT